MKDWILPAMGTFLFWGLYGFFPKITIRYINPLSTILFEALIGIPVAIVVLAVLKFRPEVHPTGVLLASLTGLLGMLGALSFLFAVRRGQVGLVSAFTALYPALTIMLAMLFLGERLELRQWFGVGLAILAMLLVAA
jgi:transporter family protein